MELTARHRITSVEWDEHERAVAMVVEITDPQTARPVDVRIDVWGASPRCAPADARTKTIGTHRPRRATIRRRRHLPRCRRGRKLERRPECTKPTAAVVGVHNTRQGRRLDGETSRSLALTAIRGALDDAGLRLDDVDGISAGPLSTALIYDLRLGPAWQGLGFGLGMITEAATAIEHGMADVVVLVAAQAGEYRDHEATAPWTRPENEFVAPWGMFTTAEFALIARRHMHVYGTTREQLSDRRGDHPQQRVAKPRSRVLPTWALHARRHHRLPAHRRPVPSPRLRHHLGGRMRAGCGERREVRQSPEPTDLCAGQWLRLPRPVLSAPAGVGPGRAAGDT